METVGGVMCTSPHPFHHHQQPITAAGNSFYYQFSEENRWKSYESEEESSSMNEEEDAWGRFLKELDVKGHEIIKKLVSKVEKNVPFEQVLRETCHHFRGESASHVLEKIARRVGRERKGGFVRRERGLDGDVLEEELKNERFKVKAVNIIGSGVVKEEEREERR